MKINPAQLTTPFRFVCVPSPFVSSSYCFKCALAGKKNNIKESARVIKCRVQSLSLSSSTRLLSCFSRLVIEAIPVIKKIRKKCEFPVKLSHFFVTLAKAVRHGVLRSFRFWKRLKMLICWLFFFAWKFVMRGQIVAGKIIYSMVLTL